MNIFRKFIMIYVVLSILIIGCKKEYLTENHLDKQIRFDLGWVNSSSSDTVVWSLTNSPTTGLHQFNINYYEQIDSVVFVVYDIKTMIDFNPYADTIKTVRIELFDVTNQNPIKDSEIVSDDIKVGTCVSSKNIAKDFPNETIDLGIRIIFDKTLYAEAGPIYLFLYRK